MIKTEVFEPTEDDPFTTIYYRDSRDIATVSVILDKDGKLVSKEISEYDEKGKLVSDVLYSNDHHTVLGYREYDYDGLSQEIGYRDYHVIDGESKFLVRTRNVWIIKEKLCHCYYYDEQNKPFAYQIFEHDEDCGMVTMGYYDMQGNDITLSNIRIPFYAMGSWMNN